MGRCSKFRATLRERSERYLLAVPSNTLIRDLETQPPEWSGRGAKPKTPFVQVARWLETLVPEQWKQTEVRDGEKGPLAVRIIKRRVKAKNQGSRKGPEELLVVTQVPEKNGKWKTDYHLSNADPETPLEELARVAKAEHRIEETFKCAKSEAGLADYEVRTWRGWHHHQVLSLVATWFLTCEARRGEKMDPSHHSANGSRIDSTVAA